MPRYNNMKTNLMTLKIKWMLKGRNRIREEKSHKIKN